MRLFELANDVLIISMKTYIIKTEIETEEISVPPSKVSSTAAKFNAASGEETK